MPRLLRLFVLCFFCSLHGYGQYTEAVFADMDMFTLEGITPLKPPFVYPYVIIRSRNNNEKDISYHINSSRVSSYHYKKINNYWLTNYISESDTSREYIYEYVMRDKIISLSYWVSPQNKISILREVNVFKKWERESLLIEKSITIKPGISVPDRVRALAAGAAIYKYEIKNGVLRDETTIYDKKQKPTYHDVTCYKIGNRSYFAWLYLSMNMEKVKCE